MVFGFAVFHGFRVWPGFFRVWPVPGFSGLAFSVVFWFRLSRFFWFRRRFSGFALRFFGVRPSTDLVDAWKNKNFTISVFRRFRPPGAVSGPRGLQKRTQDEKPRRMDPGRGPGTHFERISADRGLPKPPLGQVD